MAVMGTNSQKPVHVMHMLVIVALPHRTNENLQKGNVT